MIAEDIFSLLFITILYNSLETKGLGCLVLGCTWECKSSTTSTKDLEVCLWRFDTEIRAIICKILNIYIWVNNLPANVLKSGCLVAQLAAVCAANSSNSTVVTPGYNPGTTFWEIIVASTCKGSSP